MTVPSYRAPLLWILLPMCCGYILGHHLPGWPVWPCFFLALVLIGLAYGTQGKTTHPGRRKCWAVFFFSGVSIASLLYFQQSRRFPEVWEELPAREANLDLKVKRLYASSDPTQTKGIATVINTEDHLRSLGNHRIYFSVASDGHPVERGQRLSVRGVLNYLPSKKQRSLFEQYLYRQSVTLTINRAYLVANPRDGNLLEVFIAKLRRQAIETLGIQIEEYPEELSIYRGMMLGLKGELSAENKQLFLKTGTLHLFAISGLHVGIIAVTWAGIFLVLRIPRVPSVLLGLGLVYFYVEITGAGPSAVRAFAMIAFFWAGKSVVRPMPPFQALVASAVTVLIISPSQLFASGFQLSYTVVTGILIWGIPLFQTLRERWYSRIAQKQQHLNRFRKMINKAWELVVGTLCVSLSATISSAPLSILYFGLLAPLAVLLNMILVPMASLVIVSGVFSLITGYVSLPWLAGFFNHGPLALIHGTGLLLDWIVQLPGAFVTQAWVHDGLGYATVIIFLGSLLLVHGLKLPAILRFTFPVALTVAMIFLNTLLRII